MGKLIKRPVKSQILGSNSFLKTRNNYPFGFKTTSDIFALPSGTVSTIYTVATGGVITQVGDYKVHTFNSSSNFVVSTLGTDATVEYLVVAGGGGGGGGTGGGGGAGGLKTSTGLSIAVQSYPVVIGSGGAGLVQAHGISGVNSSFNAITSTGGGGASSNYQGNAGFSGGSGGGGCYLGTLGGAGTVGQGNAGGNGAITSPYGGGGGGGAGAAGSNGVNLGTSIGGIGLANSISGTSTYYAGGGSGGSYLATINAPLGGGGNGNGANATANTGGGGGGQRVDSATKAGNGGSGIVIIKYKNPTPITFTAATGGTVTTSGDYKIHTFNSTDNFVVTNVGTDNTVEYLVVAGGGGGGSGYGGGGGAGGLEKNNLFPIALQTYPVVVGSGGLYGTPNNAANVGIVGNVSSFDSVTSNGGGGGAGYLPFSGPGGNGASGGGGTLGGIGGTGTSQGNNGGTAGPSPNYGGGGGGGKGAVGDNGTGTVGGNGGVGLASSISGASTFYAGGGGGGTFTAGTAGLGGNGGGGNGSNTGIGTNGTANTGGGGGGSFLGAQTHNGGSGGSGIVIIKYKYQDVSYLPASQAYFDQVTTNGGSLTNAEKTYINTFIGALGTDFAEFDRLWIHGLSDSVAARTSLVNPTSTMITAVNTPTFTASQGYNSNGSTSYLNLNYNPNANGVKLTLNSASKGTYYRAIPTNSSAEGSFTSVGIYNYFSAGQFRAAVNTPNDHNSGLVRNAKLNVIYRNNSTQMYANLNGVDSTVITQSSNSIPNNNAFAFCLNLSGTPILFQAEQESVNFYGSGNINFSNLYTAIQALGTSIGWAV